MVERNLYRVLTFAITAAFFGCNEKSIYQKLGDSGNLERTSASLNSILKDVTDLSINEIQSKSLVYENGQARQLISITFLMYSDLLVKQDTLEVTINRATSFSNYSKPLEAEKLTTFNSDYTSDFFSLKIRSKDKIDSQLLTDNNDFFYIELLSETSIKGVLNFDGLMVHISEQY